MAALTAAKHLRESLGSLTLHIAQFTSITKSDTWASGIQGIVDIWTSRSDVVTTESATYFSTSVSNFATGAITVSQAVPGTATAGPGTLYVIAKD